MSAVTPAALGERYPGLAERARARGAGGAARRARAPRRRAGRGARGRGHRRERPLPRLGGAPRHHAADAQRRAQAGGDRARRDLRRGLAARSRPRDRERRHGAGLRRPPPEPHSVRGRAPAGATRRWSRGSAEEVVRSLRAKFDEASARVGEAPRRKRGRDNGDGVLAAVGIGIRTSSSFRCARQPAAIAAAAGCGQRPANLSGAITTCTRASLGSVTERSSTSS